MSEGKPTPEGWTRLHDALAYCYVLGWYAGTRGDRTDSGKMAAAWEQIARIPEYAAAPELLEACRGFVEAWDRSCQLEKTDVAVELARTAIAKAEGRS